MCVVALLVLGSSMADREGAKSLAFSRAGSTRATSKGGPHLGLTIKAVAARFCGYIRINRHTRSFSQILGGSLRFIGRRNPPHNSPPNTILPVPPRPPKPSSPNLIRPPVPPKYLFKPFANPPSTKRFMWNQSAATLSATWCIQMHYTPRLCSEVSNYGRLRL